MSYVRSRTFSFSPTAPLIHTLSNCAVPLREKVNGAVGRRFTLSTALHCAGAVTAQYGAVAQLVQSYVQIVQ